MQLLEDIPNNTFLDLEELRKFADLLFAGVDITGRSAHQLRVKAKASLR